MLIKNYFFDWSVSQDDLEQQLIPPQEPFTDLPEIKYPRSNNRIDKANTPKVIKKFVIMYLR